MKRYIIEILFSKMSNTGLKREGNDKFYTKYEIAKECCDIIKKQNIIKDGEFIVEPSAGNGAFIDFIKKLSTNYIFYDIEPEHKEIKKQDFLTLEIDNKNVTHVIGNPPFGRQSSLARKFIKKCSSFAKTISFILPKSFKKESLQKSFPLFFHLIYEIDLPNNSFLVNGKEHNVPCVFQIWEKRNCKRKVLKKEDPFGYNFVKKDEFPDISFRRVGVYAGKIDSKFEDKSVQSHYFIKFSSKEFLNKIINSTTIEFDSENTVGPRSISKDELIREFNKILKND